VSRGPVRREPYLHTWDEDGIQRQAMIHYTADDRSVVWSPRHPGDPEPWFDADTANWRCSDEDLVTLGDPNRPGFGLVDPDLDDEEIPDYRDPFAPTGSPADPADAAGTPMKEVPPMAVTKMPDVVNHAALLAALGVVRMEVESRQEDVNNLAAWSHDLATRLTDMAAELRALNVDVYTIGNIHATSDAVAGLAGSASKYADLTDTSATIADSTARSVKRRHDRIADAVDDAPVPMAKNTFYDSE